LVVFEMALALVLLVGAGLLLRSLANLYRVNPGFDPTNVLSFRIDLSPRAFPDAVAIRNFYRNFPAQIKSVPGLQSLGASSIAPLNGYAFDFPFFVSGQQAPRQGDMPLAMSYLTDREYLEALRIPLIRGRFFDERDTVGSPAVTVIDDTLANEHFPGQDPLG